MFAAAIVDIAMMLFSAVLSVGVPSTLVMFLISGAIPVLAIATVSVIEGGANKRDILGGS